VLGPFQDRVVQAATDFDKVVGLVPCAATAGPDGDPDQAPYPAQTPTGVLFGFLYKGVQQGLAGLVEAAGHAPKSGKRRRSGLRFWEVAARNRSCR
jgi:hypothetical protein